MGADVLVDAKDREMRVSKLEVGKSDCFY
jgi:hypothetical protein